MSNIRESVSRLATWLHILHLVVLLPVIVPVFLVIIPGWLLCLFVWGIVLRIWFWQAHRMEGRFILFVYSESPNWQSYVEENILPKIATCAVVINWSERKRWSAICPWEARVFKHWAGDGDFNPMALVFTGRLRVTDIRFYQAFRDFKHGRPERLHKAEAELFACLPSLPREVA